MLSVTQMAMWVCTTPHHAGSKTPLQRPAEHPCTDAPGRRHDAGAAEGVAQGDDRRRRHEVVVSANIAGDLHARQPYK